MENKKKTFKIMNFKFILILFCVLVCIIFAIIYIKNLYKDDYSSQAIEEIKSIASYKASVDIVVKNSKQEIVCSGKEIYDTNRGGKLLLEKNTYFFNGNSLSVKDANGMEYTSEEKADVYRFCFLQEYMKYFYLEGEMHAEPLEYRGRKCDMISFELAGNNKNIHWASIYYDLDRSVPLEIKVYNEDNKEVMYIMFKEFMKNIDINDEEL
ncbi:Outer membrane lipoprotein-sorting protein [Hathewaya proteolytica DSM 3090]|uniref:Outer membrane lipoprotein-sorting protein n=1 Tax=Hathewaya proteolytica DSM 3090 TaxID=1121331 RepID=A0A1M6NEP4_9CLOT|nr:germination lipoprotein GerS-related protein [Hathewaya proteolytica]SHJ94123.1 Outer membrane lipoprotein-sorting protein [Hathewaya proteolytica DSM 3090]